MVDDRGDGEVDVSFDEFEGGGFGDQGAGDCCFSVHRLVGFVELGCDD